MSFEGDLPLYQQLAELLKEGISTGRYKQGQKLPTELELCELYHVSRNTVRGALRTWKKKICCYASREKEPLSARKNTIITLFPPAALPTCAGKLGAKLTQR